MIFSYCFVGIMVLWLLVVTIVVIWSGLEGTIFISNGQSLSLPLGIPNLDVPETVQLKLVDGATYQVIGLVAVSAMYLFGVRRKKIDDPGA